MSEVQESPSWDKFEYEYWDIGEEKIVRLSQRNMSNIMLALVQCDGKLHDSSCVDKIWGTSELKLKPDLCYVVMRISLPRGAAPEFERISGITPTIPENVGI